ncbi:hypothetical protein F0L68_38400 [Solihabitans fulvus]|uniref:Zinc finger CGNR domain-containing protein n=1 Tax=Solihabitans fulvus TaxID=1892852 RepID=A0A5B2WLR0_9PSEU|nr:ABATE domain-containing protein [Solihabitans fulvus]KAA2250967.1 hypothetical protein F0L68_38400 [Solihabitans fulvus]
MDSVDALPMPVQGEPLPLDLVNTTFIHGGLRGVLVDAMSSPAQLDDWLAARLSRLGPALADRLVEESATDRRLAAFLDLRAALRALLAEQQGGEPAPAAARAEVNRAARGAAGWVELGDGAPPAITRRWTEPDPYRIAAGEVAVAAVELLSGPDREHLRACAAPGCILYFLKTHSRREWCSSVCGNRVRVARHSRRHADG